MSPAPGGETAAQEAERVATVIYETVCRMVIDGVCTMDGGIAGLRWAGITLQAAIEIKGHDTSRVEQTVAEMMAAMEAATKHKGRMQ